jgi:hypothetical protein
LFISDGNPIDIDVQRYRFKVGNHSFFGIILSHFIVYKSVIDKQIDSLGNRQNASYVKLYKKFELYTVQCCHFDSNLNLCKTIHTNKKERLITISR